MGSSSSKALSSRHDCVLFASASIKFFICPFTRRTLTRRGRRSKLMKSFSTVLRWSKLSSPNVGYDIIRAKIPKLTMITFGRISSGTTVGLSSSSCESKTAPKSSRGASLSYSIGAGMNSSLIASSSS